MLEKAKLVRVVRTRKVRALTEKYYGRVARLFILRSADESARHGPGRAEADRRLGIGVDRHRQLELHGEELGDCGDECRAADEQDGRQVMEFESGGVHGAAQGLDGSPKVGVDTTSVSTM